MEPKWNVALGDPITSVFHFLSEGTHTHAPCVITHFLFSTKSPLFSSPSRREVDVLVKNTVSKGDVNTFKTWHFDRVGPKVPYWGKEGRVRRRFCVYSCIVFFPHVRFLRRWSPASVVWRRTTSSRRVIWRRWSAVAVFAQTREAGRKTR